MTTLEAYLGRLGDVDLLPAIKENDLIPQLQKLSVDPLSIVLACSDNFSYTQDPNNGQFVLANRYLSTPTDGTGVLPRILRRENPPTYKEAMRALDKMVDDGDSQKVYARVDVQLSGGGKALHFYVCIGAWAKK